MARSAPKTALDVGCGTGQLARDLYHRGYQVTGIDISTEAISQAQASTIYTQGITFAVRDITKPPLPPCHYGLITCKYVVAFIADRATFFRAIGTLLEATGGGHHHPQPSPCAGAQSPYCRASHAAERGAGGLLSAR